MAPAQWVRRLPSQRHLTPWFAPLPPRQVCVLVFVGAGSHRNEVLSADWKRGDGLTLVSAGMDDYIMVW